MTEEQKKKRPMIYLGHPIRGKKTTYGETVGPDDPVYDYETDNCEQAIINVGWLRHQFRGVRFYCPGEVEVPIQMAHRLGFMNIDQILKMDFEIIRQLCVAGLFHKWEDSKGVDKEIERCVEWSYPHLILEDCSRNIWSCDREKIAALVQVVLEQDVVKST
jgi:hypothetical protein